MRRAHNVFALIIFLVVVCTGYFLYADDMYIMDDGSVKYISPDGTEKVVSMDGKTPYGMNIKEERKVLRRRSFVVELVYSAQLSDDNMDKYLTPFFKELESQIVRWMYNHQVPKKTMRIAVSNCRFCKTGFCKRKNKREIAIIRFTGDKEEKMISFKHEDIIAKKKHPELVAKTIETLLGK